LLNQIVFDVIFVVLTLYSLYLLLIILYRYSYLLLIFAIAFGLLPIALFFHLRFAYLFHFGNHHFSQIQILHAHFLNVFLVYVIYLILSQIYVRFVLSYYNFDSYRNKYYLTHRLLL